MKYLFMFTIGPVKSFIENSRKARDMYAGSKVLSGLMQEAICWLETDGDIRILFPIKSNKEKVPNMPNRLVAEFKGYSKGQLRETAEKLSAFIHQTFLQNSLTMLKAVDIEGNGLAMAKNQLENFLEIYWVFEPFEDIDYATAYQNLFTSMHDVKSVRCFEQANEPWGRKCMLFSEYNAIFAKKHKVNEKSVFPYNTNTEYVYDISRNHFLRYDVKEKEALSAIALVKRVYNNAETQIYSTRQMLLKSRIYPSVFEEAEISVSDGKMMDHIANVVYDMENGNTWSDNAYPLEAVAQAKQLYIGLKKYNIHLSSYYGLVKFDGDSMGEIFRQIKNIADQQQLSEQISQFAYKASDILSEHGGLPVFAGGEDFLGFLPLDNLFDCLKKLHHEFATHGLTFSSGIAIAHLMQPLKEVMAEADRLEQTAKNLDGKNAFAIGIIKRSGDDVRMPSYHLSTISGQPVLEDMQELIQLLKDSGCSKTLFFQIARLMDVFLQEDTYPEVAMMEALLKKCMITARVNGNLVSREDLLRKILLFYRSAENGRDFLNTLNGIVFLSREVI